MAGSHRLFTFTFVAAALAFVATLPARTWDAVGRFIMSWPSGDLVRRLSDLFRGPPALALVGPGGEPIGASHYHRNRHEAGLARLGTVRHR